MGIYNYVYLYNIMIYSHRARENCLSSYMYILIYIEYVFSIMSMYNIHCIFCFVVIISGLLNSNFSYFIFLSYFTIIHTLILFTLMVLLSIPTLLRITRNLVTPVLDHILFYFIKKYIIVWSGSWFGYNL